MLDGERTKIRNLFKIRSTIVEREKDNFYGLKGWESYKYNFICITRLIHFKTFCLD